MDDDVLWQRVDDARVGRLATVRASGEPHVVPCCFVRQGHTLYTAVDDLKPKASPQLRRLDNIAAQPRAALLVDHYSEDWSTLWWIRLDGAARVVIDDRERASALALLGEKYEPYRRQPPPGAVIAIDVDRPRAWP